MKTIAIIDDDICIGNMLEEILVREGYDVIRAYSGTEALMLLSVRTPDLILLDLMLPGLSGEALLPKLRNIPVIVVSAKADAEHKAELLYSGAADYVTKPFYTKELLARIAVALRNTAARTALLHYGAISLNTANFSVSVDGRDVKLTRTEYAILKYLMINSAGAVSKSQLLDHISPDTPDCTENSLKIHVSNLRKKLRDVSGKDYIEAVWGIGFKLKE